ncbi:thiolase family protein [Agromyces bracchium]|uniref:Probable acetyl-CoA acetyltransferase n=1 Tax=Agromyces bracchium TaxID=88376 RepID=A0A6I3M1K7_9MICO|nr:thiolase family protein [Agromyces bracchium]MTH66798.1 acetyl-CoA C-acyltransferase [Agromyces bracchium]
MTRDQAPVIVAARRTAIGTAGRALAGHTVDALAAPVLAAVAAEVAPAGVAVDDVVLGNCMGPGGDLARVAALRAELGAHVPGVTVDRQCGSGLDAVIQAASRVRAGDAGLVLAGGAESASTAPHRVWPDSGERYTRAPFAPAGLPDPDMGPAAEHLAQVRGITRERQDAWAARSHSRAAAARDAGRFDAEVVAIDGVARDDRPRASMDVAMLARFAPAFVPESEDVLGFGSVLGFRNEREHATSGTVDITASGADGTRCGTAGTVTAGNSCGFSDGAAAMAVATADLARDLGLPALRIRATAVAAGDPALPGLGAAWAGRRALERAGMTAADLGFVEITEAFAAQVLAVSDELGLDQETISGDGGAIALGHPWGASGAILLVRLAARMAAVDDARAGLAACSIGGGQGVAMIVERVA